MRLVAPLLLSILLAALLCRQGWAQDPLFHSFKRFDTENGLPQSFVTGIVQDQDGFLWVSTMEGLGRYDGKDFLRFGRTPDESTSLSSSRIHSIVQDDKGDLWVLHVEGMVDRMNTRTFVVTPKVSPILNGEGSRFTATFPHRWGVLLDINGNWLTYGRDSSLLLFDTTSVVLFRRFVQQSSEASRIAILRHHLGTDGIMWLMTGHGLERMDSGVKKSIQVGLKEEIRNWDLSRPPMLVDMDDRLIIGGPGVLHTYHPEAAQWGTISIPELPGQSRFLISIFCKGKDGQLYFEYKGHVLRLDKQGSVKVIWKMPSPFEVSALFVDRTNTLWIGTNADGLYQVNLNAVPFQKFTMRSNFISDIIGDQFNVPATQLNAFSFGISKSYYLRYFYRDRESILLTLENQSENPGILLLRNGSLKRVHGLGHVDSFAAGPDGLCLVLENQDLITLNAQWRAQVIRTTLPKTTNQLIVEMEMDGTSLWMATVKEIFQLKDGKVVKSRTFVDGHPICTIKNDPNDHKILWVGTLGGGLYKVDKGSLNTLVAYTINEGLPNNTINAIVPDTLGGLWVSTNRGISRFDPSKQSFANFTTSDGLHETEFNRYHHMVLPDGRIAFGGSRGYTVFNPALFVPDTLQPKIMVTRLTVNGDEHKLSRPLAQADRLEFDHSENSIGFELAATQFNSPEKNRYRYRLVGIDPGWVDNGYDRRVRYNKLPFGEYLLELNASNTVGQWSSAVRRIAVIIHPPVWQTSWAYASYGFLLIGGLSVFWTSYKARLKSRQEAAFNQREAQRWREVDEVKTRFFSNITHEFRTPLTLILTPLEKHLDEKELPEKISALLRNNFRHASKLLQLVNQLLDIAKLEAGQMPVHMSPGELVPFVRDCVIAFQAESERKSIALRLDAPMTEGHFLFDKDKLEKILVNILSNALKFTPTGGSVVCSLEIRRLPGETKELVAIGVTDTGIGIDEAQQRRVFERFHQVDDTSTRQHEGTGIGLALVKELVLLMGGAINLESALGKGTSITVTLPMERIGNVGLTGDVLSAAKNDQHSDVISNIQGEGMPVILVVEDNEELRAFLVENLSVQWRVLEANNGNKAWELLETELPEIVVSDIMMPGVSGIELCKRTKRDHRTAHISFIMLTAKAAQESKIMGFEAGADEYVTKPFHLYELQLRIRNLLQKQANLRRHLQNLLLPKISSKQLVRLSDPFLDKVFAYLEDNLEDTDLNVEKVANALAMSKSTLNRKFRVLINQTPSDFVRQFRLNHALRLLEGPMTVAEISALVGFESPSYFTQCFREQFGLTPSSFRQGKSNTAQ